MSDVSYVMGDSFTIQFVWRLPNDDYLRAIFEVTVTAVEPDAEKFIVRLDKFVAGRQEKPTGVVRPQADVSLTYWQLVNRLVGQKVKLAYEARDGRPLHMRLGTLTGEHNFFFRYE